MPTEDTHSRINVKDDGARAGVERGEPGGRGARDAGAARAPRGSVAVDELPPGVRDRLSDGLVDELLAGARTEEEIVGPGGLLADLTRRLVERALSAELTEHVGYQPHQEPRGGTGNARNGTTPKTLVTEHGPVAIKTPRDRQGTFAPQIVRKGQRRFQGFDDKILALYARGLSVRDIEAHLAEIYGAKVGRDLISRVTDAVMEDVRAWQQRPLDDVYPGRVLGLPGLEDPRGRQRAAARLLPRARRHRRRRSRRARPVVPRDRGREVLDASPRRAQAARHPRHPDLLRRRPQGVPEAIE